MVGEVFYPINVPEDKDYTAFTPTSRKRRRVITTATTSPGPSPANKTEDHNDFSCPLVDCSRQCDSKKLLLLHLAISHYQEELEDRYINGQYCITMINKQCSILSLKESVVTEAGCVLTVEISSPA